MVFSINNGEEMPIYARKKNSEIFMSDPVCLVNEDGLEVAGEPSKLGAVNSLFSEKAAFKLEYALDGNSSGRFGFKRRFWKRMNVETITLQMHAQNIGRKIEPFLVRALKGGVLQQSGSCLVEHVSLDILILRCHVAPCIHMLRSLYSYAAHK